MAVEEVADKVTSWLQQLGKGIAEQILLEARRMLIDSADSDRLPKERAPKGWTVDAIIAKCEPVDLGDGEASYLHYYAVWLARWVFFVAPDPNVHIPALDLAWGRTIARAA